MTENTDSDPYVWCKLPLQQLTVTQPTKMEDSVVNLTSDTFSDEVEKATGPILIDFWSNHCPPCKILSPTLDQVASEMGTNAKITKVDVLAERDLAVKFSVKTIPTLIFMKDGEIKHTQTGIMLKNAIIEKLSTL